MTLSRLFLAKHLIPNSPFLTLVRGEVAELEAALTQKLRAAAMLYNTNLSLISSMRTNLRKRCRKPSWYHAALPPRMQRGVLSTRSGTNDCLFPGTDGQELARGDRRSAGSVLLHGTGNAPGCSWLQYQVKVCACECCVCLWILLLGGYSVPQKEVREVVRLMRDHPILIDCMISCAPDDLAGRGLPLSVAIVCMNNTQNYHH